MLAASTAEVMSARTGTLEIKPEAPHPPGNVGNPNIRVIALKPLIKILPVTRLRRNPDGAVSQLLPNPWSTELKQRASGLIATRTSGHAQILPQLVRGAG